MRSNCVRKVENAANVINTVENAKQVQIKIDLKGKSDEHDELNQSFEGKVPNLVI